MNQWSQEQHQFNMMSNMNMGPHVIGPMMPNSVPGPPVPPLAPPPCMMNEWGSGPMSANADSTMGPKPDDNQNEKNNDDRKKDSKDRRDYDRDRSRRARSPIRNRNDRSRNDRRDRRPRWSDTNEKQDMPPMPNMANNMMMPSNNMMQYGNMMGQQPMDMGNMSNMGNMGNMTPMMYGMNMMAPNMPNMMPNMMMDPNMMMQQQMNQTIFITNAALLPPLPNINLPTRREKPPGCRTIFVGGLPANGINENVAAEIFQRFGTITDIKLHNNGVCHVRFDKQESVEQSFQIAGYRFKYHNQSDNEASALFVDYALVSYPKLQPPPSFPQVEGTRDTLQQDRFFTPKRAKVSDLGYTRSVSSLSWVTETVRKLTVPSANPEKHFSGEQDHKTNSDSSPAHSPELQGTKFRPKKKSQRKRRQAQAARLLEAQAQEGVSRRQQVEVRQTPPPTERSSDQKGWAMEHHPVRSEERPIQVYESELLEYVAGEVWNLTGSSGGTTLNTNQTKQLSKKQLKRLQRQQPVPDNMARAHLDIVILNERTTRLSKEEANNVLIEIQKRILEDAKACTSRVPPTFTAKPVHAHGFLKLWCNNESTVEWVQQVVSAMPTPSGDNFLVKRQADVQRVRCGIVVPNPDSWDNPNDIELALSFQNDWAKIDKWSLTRAQKQAKAWFLNFSVPKDLVPPLLERNRRLHCGCGTVYVKFQGQGGKYFEVPPGYESGPSSKQLAIQTNATGYRNK